MVVQGCTRGKDSRYVDVLGLSESDPLKNLFLFLCPVSHTSLAFSTFWGLFNVNRISVVVDLGNYIKTI